MHYWHAERSAALTFSSMSDKIFPEGMNVTAPSDRAPDFVKARIGIRPQHFHEWAKQHVDDRGWVNIDILEGRTGKWYASLNTYKKTADGDDVQTISLDEEPF